MKKKILITTILLLLLIVVGITYYIISNNRIVSTITLDINPSLELKLNKNNIVLKVDALNDDASNIISNDLENISLDSCLNKISSLLEKDYVEDNEIVVLIHSSGLINNNDIKSTISSYFEQKNIISNVIVIDDITDEDRELSNKYNISVAKASYIRSIKNDMESINIEDLLDRSIIDLKNTKEKKLYCDNEYLLDGDRCIKEKERVAALTGFVCSSGYYDYNGRCYREVGMIEVGDYTCEGDFQLVNNECVKSTTYLAMDKCENGTSDGNGNCIEKKYVSDAFEFCRDPGRTLYQHKCLATKPSINGGCLNGDMLLNGKCVNTRDDYYMAEWKCQNGQIKSNADGSLLDNDTKCYEEVVTKVNSYYCNENDTLVGNECQNIEYSSPIRKTSCPEGFQEINDKCLDLKDVRDKKDGYYCDNGNRLEGNMCIVYDIIEAHHL